MRGPKPKNKIICPRCNRLSQPVRGYCKNCITVLVHSGEIEKIQVDNSPRELTKVQEEVLNGLMLGDGCLYRRKITHKPYLAVQRKQDDRNYVIENYNVFKDFCKRQVQDGELFDKRTNNTTYYSKFTSRRCEVFERYYSKWYPNGVKVIPHDIILTPLTLAIWFADDGHVRFSKKDGKGKLRLQLSSENFELKDIILIKEKMELILNADFSIQRNKRIHGYAENAYKFFAYIDKSLPVSMTRKALWRNQ